MRSGKAKVLVVDDVDRNLFSMKVALKSLDVEVYTAPSGIKALELLKQNRFAVLLLDVQMPGMSGFELAKQIREDYTDYEIPIIFVTAMNKEEDSIQEGYALGAVDYLFKPVRPQVLRSKVTVFKKISEQQMHLENTMLQLAKSSQRTELLLSCASEGILGLNNQGNIIFANPMAKKMLCSKVDQQDVLGTSIVSVMASSKNATSYWKENPIYRACYQGQHYHMEEDIFQRLDGTCFPVEYNVAPLVEKKQTNGFVLMFQDISLRKEAEAQLIRLSQYDHLTGLPNRVKFYDILAHEVDKRKGDGQKNNIGLFFLDLDNFKTVNDTLGHVSGDVLLRRVAERLTQRIPEAEVIGRLGGDEFALLFPDLSNIESSAHIAENLLNCLREPFDISGHEVVINTSIGISTYSDGKSPEELIKAADSAVYHAKSKGVGQYQFFEPRMHEQAMARLELEKELSKVLANNQLALHYQPKIDMCTGNLMGAEALLRWNHPAKGFIPPGSFIPIAENSDIILALGEWVMRTACREIQSWCKQGLADNDLSIAVNVSPIQLADKNFVQTLTNVLQETGLRPEQLEIELTENALMHNIKDCIQTLECVQDLGVKIAIDDFGTGFSSLSYLRNLPIHTLKVDRSFVKDIDRGAHNIAIVETIIRLAHSLSLNVVAEGIETEGELSLLTDCKCDIYQGYYFSKPVPASEFVKRLLIPRARQAELG